MLSWVIGKLKTINLWHLLWVTMLLAELLTAVTSALMSYLWWGRLHVELLLINVVVSFVASLLAAYFTIFLLVQLRNSERAAEEEVRKLNQELERRVAERTAELVKAQKMEAVGRLAGGIAHDFNNLLTVIRGDCEMALMEIGKDNPARFSLTQIKKASHRASDLTRRLMLFSRQKPMTPVNLDISSVVHDMLQMLNRLLGEDITVVSELKPGLMAVHADKAGLEQVIMNIVLNARDAMPDGGRLTIKTDEAPPQEKPGLFVMISVSDTGVGIAKENLPYIFDPFYTGKEIGKGTGLGLSTAYGIVEQHGGWITVDSEPGKGSTFSVFLEAGTFSDASKSVADKVASTFLENHLRDRSGSRILLVEDDDVVGSYVARTLRNNGYEVFHAPAAEDALRIFEREKGDFHLVFTDVVLPGMSGVQLIDCLHKVKPRLPVLVCSGYTDKKSQWPVIQKRGYRFLEKPYDLPDLLNAVRETI